MELSAASERFQALSNPTRLRAFRLIIRAGKTGMRAGDIAQGLDVPSSTLSNHLSVLEKAGLVQSWRVQTAIYYAVVDKGIKELIQFLTEDCCRGAPELCGFRAHKASAPSKTGRSA